MSKIDKPPWTMNNTPTFSFGYLKCAISVPCFNENTAATASNLYGLSL